jgi:hypothetical protein
MLLKRTYTEITTISTAQSQKIFGPGSTTADASKNWTGQKNPIQGERGILIGLTAKLYGPNMATFDPSIAADTGELAAIADEFSKFASGIEIHVWHREELQDVIAGDTILPAMPMRFVTGATTQNIALFSQDNGALDQPGDKRVISFVDARRPQGILLHDDIFFIELKYNTQAGANLQGSQIKWFLLGFQGEWKVA